MTLTITISGLHGTGKSTYARILSKSFNLRHISAGEFFRQIACKKGVSISELSQIASKNDEIDKLIDERTKSEAKRKNVILDGLLSGWIAKDEADIKIFLTATERIRIERIAKRDQISYQTAKKTTLLRERLERRRFKKRYNIDIFDTSIYDLTLNTGLLPPKVNIKVIEKFIREYIKAYLRG